MTYVGIDPGKTGAMAIMWARDMVEIIPFDEIEYLTALSTLRPSDTRCVVEHVGSMPGNGGKAMFTFGENFGLIQGYLRARGIPFQLVRPQKERSLRLQLAKGENHEA